MQIERLRALNAKARRLGSIALKTKKVEKTATIVNKARLEINNLDDSYLKVAGAMLYWAEGSKQNDNKLSKELIFTNSDPKMIRIYLLWLKRCLLVKKENIKFEIYIHETYLKTPL